MAKNITFMGASYSNVPAVRLPQTGGGMARFDDVSVTTATANDVTNGKVFVASDGTVTTGKNTGGGSSGAKVEHGTCTMTTSLLTINHSLGVKPDFIVVYGTSTGTNTQKTHNIVYDSKVSTTQALYQYYRSDSAVKKNVSNTKNSTSYVYMDSSVVTLPYYSSSYTFQGAYNFIVGTYQ